VHDAKHALRDGVVVTGSWNGSGSVTCTTDGSGTCSVSMTFPNSTRLVSFAVSGLSLAGAVYQSAANHDPDGSSNGTSIIVKR
jgi:hypothetical protein